jgi:glycine C-acetyltransferase
MDIFEKVVKNMGPIGQFAHMSHQYFTFPKLTGEIGPHMTFNGKKMLNWSLNNYLGLANHPEVRKADEEGTAQYGLAYPMGARMMSGNSDLHEELEAKLAAYVGKEDSFLLNFGYQGVMSVVDAMVDRHDVIVYDADSHACLIDGTRMHVGQTYKFLHNDIESLEKNLQRATRVVTENQRGGILVITEGVFGMSGNLGKLDEIVKLKEKYNFRLLVDDAHGFGTMGTTGSGVPEHMGVTDGVDLHFSTFAKSMASIGAFVAAKKDVIMYLKYNMRSQIYAKSLPMPLVVGGLKRLEIIQKEPQLREQLWTIVNALQDGFRSQGFNIGTTQSPVTPVFMNGTFDELGLTVMVRDMRERMGIFCSIVSYPVVPKGVIILRIIPTAAHTLEDVAYTMECFADLKEKLASGFYNTVGK